MNRSIIISSVLHLLLILVTAMSLPFLAKKPLDIPPIVSVELIQIAEKTNIPFELYFFSSEMDKEDADYRGNKRSKNFNYKPGDMGIDRIKLVNVASHKLKKQKLDESCLRKNF